MKKKSAKAAPASTSRRGSKTARAAKKSALRASPAKADRKTTLRKGAAATRKPAAKKAATKQKRPAPSPRVQKKRAMRNFQALLEEKHQRDTQTPAWQEIEHHDHSSPPALPPRKS